MDLETSIQRCCLVCLSPSDSNSSTSNENIINLETSLKNEVNFHGQEEEEVVKTVGHSVLLADHLRVVFLLKNLLEIPNDTLETFLENWGHPAEWIRLCTMCQNLVQKAWNTYEDMLVTMRQLATFRSNIVEGMRSTRVSRVDTTVTGDNHYVLEPIMDEIGNFVTAKIYSQVTITYPCLLENSRVLPLISPKHEIESDHGDDNDYEDIQHDPLLLLCDDNNTDEEWQPDNKDYEKDYSEHENDSTENSDDDYLPEKNNRKNKRQIRIVLTDQEFKCKFCGKEYLNEHSLSVHFGRSHGKETRQEKYSCDVEGCGKEFKWKQNYKDHMARHMNKTRFKCDICGREFLKLHSFKYHQEAHKRNTIATTFAGDKLGADNKSGYSTKVSDTSKQKILDEEVISSPSLKNQDSNCKFCGKIYENKHALDVHIGKKHKKHSLKNQKLICSVDGCQKVYQSRQAYELHLAKHRKEPRYRCILCKREFYERASFLYHKAAHQRRTIGKNKIVKTKKSLKQKSRDLPKKIKDQQNIDDNDAECQPNNSGNCKDDNNEKQKETNENSGSDNFPKEDKSTTHRRLEANQEFKCKFCGKEYQNEHGLSVHLGRSHGKETRQEKYVCEVDGCGKEFKWKQNCKDHMARHMNETKFKCDICGREFFKKQSFEYHQEAHQRNTIASTLNEEKWAARQRLNVSHQKILDEELISPRPLSTENQDLNCKFCGKIYENKHALDVHIGKMHRKHSVKSQGFICWVEGCLKRYQSRQAFEIHLAKHRKEPRYRCIKCGKEFYERGSFLYHKAAHQRGTISSFSGLKAPRNDKQKFVCTVEGCEKKEFSWVHSYRTHMMEKHGQDKRFDCGQCGKKFFRKASYLFHKQAHKKLKTVKATAVKMKAESTESISAPVVDDVEDGESYNPKPYICELCGKGYTSEQTLKSHMLKTKLHLPADQLPEFKCEFCGQEFLTKNTLTYHLLKHKNKDEGKGNSEGSLQCEHCGISFKNKGQLTQHIKSHVGPSPQRDHDTEPAEIHICNLCGKHFRKMEYLRSHKRFIHEKKWVHFCKLCGKGMKCTQHLRLHMRTSHQIFEEGVKSFKCPVQGCARRFFYEQRFKDHMEKYHPSGGEGDPHPYTCHQCGKGFWTITRLKTHLLTRQHVDSEGKRRRRRK